MEDQPTLETERLVLRPFHLDDANDVQRLAGVYEVAGSTSTIPYPYLDGAAEEWISTHKIAWTNRESVSYAIVSKATNQLVGCVSCFNLQTDQPEIGYWVAHPHWNSGFCTEACMRVIKFGFDQLMLQSIYGRHMSRNPASGKVMQKCGMMFIRLGTDTVRGRSEEYCLYKATSGWA